MARTIDQQIADAQAKLARLKTRQKASDTRRKIIVGAIVTTEALKDPKISKWLASTHYVFSSWYQHLCKFLVIWVF